MTTLLKTVLVAGSLGIAGFLTSCQTAGGPTGAVACPKCKTVWVNSGASAGKGNPVALRAAGAMQCADCENTATAMLKGLSVNTHTCKSCGTTLQHCR
jgi:ribosomal protein S27E